MGKQKLTKEEVYKALVAAGTVSDAARLLGVVDKTVYNYMDRYPELKDAIKEARERLCDTAEGKLKDLIEDGHASSIFFYLKTIGKNRGYTERQEVSGIDGAPVESKVTIEFIDAPDKSESK